MARYSPASSLTVPHYRVSHRDCRASFASFVTEARTVTRLWGFPRPPFNLLRLSIPSHSSIYSTLPRRTVIRPPVRCQAKRKNEIQLEVANRRLNRCIHFARREPYTAALQGFWQVGLAASGIEHGCYRYPSVEPIGAGVANSGNPVSTLKYERDRQCSDQQS
jgi:hypothetical protein